MTSDLRHHPASELREHADADPATPALVDVPHAAAEWTWLPVLAARSAHDPRTTTVEVRVSQTPTDPWTYHLPMPADDQQHRDPTADRLKGANAESRARRPVPSCSTSRPTTPGWTG